MIYYSAGHKRLKEEEATVVEYCTCMYLVVYMGSKK